MCLVAKDGITDIVIMRHLYTVKDNVIFDLCGISYYRSFSDDCRTTDKRTVADLRFLIDNEWSV